jgi:catechol-2,3-dioxygenase
MSRNGLVVAGIVVGVALQTGIAQKHTEMYVNHVGIAVPSVPDARAFYTQKMGFREAFKQEANAQRPAGATQGDRQLEII